MKSFRTLLVAVTALASSYQGAYALPWYDGAAQPACILSTISQFGTPGLPPSAKWTCEPVIEAATVLASTIPASPNFLRQNQNFTILTLDNTPSGIFENGVTNLLVNGSGTDANEINAYHFTMTIGAGVTITSGTIETLETQAVINGTLNDFETIIAQPIVNSGGSVSGFVTGLYWNPTFNTGSSVGVGAGLYCQQSGGSVQPTFNDCVEVNDPNQSINTKGHLATQSGSGVHAAGGTLDGNASDLAGTITLTSAAATVTLGVPCYQTGHLQLTTTNGAATPTSVTKSANGFTINGVSGAVYDYLYVCYIH